MNEKQWTLITSRSMSGFNENETDWLRALEGPLQLHVFLPTSWAMSTLKYLNGRGSKIKLPGPHTNFNTGRPIASKGFKTDTGSFIVQVK